MAITNKISHAIFTVMMERALQKQLQLVRSAAKGKGDTEQVEKIDRIAAELKKEEYLLKALKTLEDAKETIDQPSLKRLTPSQPPKTK